MKRKNINIFSFKNLLTKNHHSSKINNKFKKSSTTQYNYINKNEINSINNIYLNLFNKFNNNTCIHKNGLNPNQIISTRINNSHININKDKNNSNILEVPSSSFIKKKKNNNSSLINSMNFIDNHGHINIRLNLKNQFINNNTSVNMNNNSSSNKETNYNSSELNEKVKEKDFKIMQLQNELLKSQEIINNFQNKNDFQNNHFNKHKNLNISSREKNIRLLTKSSESIDKLLKTTSNGFSCNNLTKKKSSRKKNYKNNFLKKYGNKNLFECIKNINVKENSKNNNNLIRDKTKTSPNIYIGNYKKKQSDYLRLFLPLSSINNKKPKFNSYSNDKKTKSYTENMNKTEKNKNIMKKIYNRNELRMESFYNFTKMCDELKSKTQNLLDKYINLCNYLINK